MSVERKMDRSNLKSLYYVVTYFVLSGERAGTRTPNLVIKSHLLYQLSYAPRYSTRRNDWRRCRLRGAGLAAFFREIAIVSPWSEDAAPPLERAYFRSVPQPAAPTEIEKRSQRNLSAKL